MEAENLKRTSKIPSLLDKEERNLGLSTSIKQTFGKYGERSFLNQKQTNKKQRTLKLSYAGHNVIKLIIRTTAKINDQITGNIRGGCIRSTLDF